MEYIPSAIPLVLALLYSNRIDIKCSISSHFFLSFSLYLLYSEKCTRMLIKRCLKIVTIKIDLYYL